MDSLEALFDFDSALVFGIGGSGDIVGSSLFTVGLVWFVHDTSVGPSLPQQATEIDRLPPEA